MNTYKIKYLYNGERKTFDTCGDSIENAMKKFRAFFPHSMFISLIRFPEEEVNYGF